MHAFNKTNKILVTTTAKYNDLLELINSSFPKLPGTELIYFVNKNGRRTKNIEDTLYVFNNSLTIFTKKKFTDKSFLDRLITAYLVYKFKNLSVFSWINRPSDYNRTKEEMMKFIKYNYDAYFDDDLNNVDIDSIINESITDLMDRGYIIMKEDQLIYQ
jgi:hypothetical protein